MAIETQKLRDYMQLPASSILPEAAIQPSIDSAALIVSEDMGSSGLTQERLDLIELNLAAHFATISVNNGGIEEVQVGESRERYRAISDIQTGLATTNYGQMAISLDISGTLSKLISTRRARFEVI